MLEMPLLLSEWPPEDESELGGLTRLVPNSLLYFSIICM
jgi:hypothetical protein